MQIDDLPLLTRDLQSGDDFALDDSNGVTYRMQLLTQVNKLIQQSTAITSGNLTSVYSNITNVEIARWVKCGNVVSVVCKFTISESSDVPTTQIMFSGAPRANSAYNTAPRFMAMHVSSGTYKKPIRLALNSSGNIVAWYIYGNSIPYGQYEFTITYISA